MEMEMEMEMDGACQPGFRCWLRCWPPSSATAFTLISSRQQPIRAPVAIFSLSSLALVLQRRVHLAHLTTIHPSSSWLRRPNVDFICCML